MDTVSAEKLSRLFRRFLSDDEHEGLIALQKARSAALKMVDTPDKIHVIIWDGDNTNISLSDGVSSDMALAKSRGRRIEELEREVSQLTEQLTAYKNKAKVATKQVATIRKRSKADAFPWHDYPTLELTLCREALQKGKTSFIKPWQDRIVKETGIAITEGSIKQRIGNNAPPDELIKGIDLKLPSWAALWYLGSKLSARSWTKTVFDELKLPNRRVGADISDVTVEMMTLLHDKVMGYSHGNTPKWLKKIIKEAGKDGITLEDIYALDYANKKNIRKRIREQLNETTIFLVGDRYVHPSYRDYHPDEWLVVEHEFQKRRTAL